MLYLASQSPRRRHLLEQIGVPHTVLALGTEAEALEAQKPGEAPARYVRRVARAKLAAALHELQARGFAVAPVLCADTCVALGQRIYGKPRDAHEAVQMLGELAGREHTVLTAVALGLPDGTPPHEALSRSRVRFAPLSTAEIAAYVATGEPLDKAGSYALQGRASLWISRLEGSYSSVIGLPLYLVRRLLLRGGYRF